MKKEKSCGFIIFTNVEGVIKFLIIQQLEGFHSFPKGHMEGNETELETAFREVKEEVNIIPTLIEGFRESESHLIPSRNNILKDFLCLFGGGDSMSWLGPTNLWEMRQKQVIEIPRRELCTVETS